MGAEDNAEHTAQKKTSRSNNHGFDPQMTMMILLVAYMVLGPIVMRAIGEIINGESNVAPFGGDASAYDGNNDFVTGKVREVFSLEDLEHTLAYHSESTGLPVIVDFYSPTCGPCHQIAPIYKQIAMKFKGRAAFLKVNTQHNHQAAIKYGVHGLPTFLFFLRAEVQKRFSGYNPSALQRNTISTLQLSEQEGFYFHLDQKGMMVAGRINEKQLQTFYKENKPLPPPDQENESEDPDSKNITAVNVIPSTPRDIAMIATEYQGRVSLFMRRVKAKYGAAPQLSVVTGLDAFAITLPHKKEKEDTHPLSGSVAGEREQEIDVTAMGTATAGQTEDLFLNAGQSMSRIEASTLEPERVVIIGGGPAGLAAAIYAARAGLKPLVVAPSFGGQLLAKGVDVENYPGVIGAVATGKGIVSLMRTQAAQFNASLMPLTVTGVDLSKRPFSVEVTKPVTLDLVGEGAGTEAEAETATLRAFTLVVATGADSRWLGVPGEAALQGSGVSTCATCDGYLFRDKRVLVVGGGDTAMEDALVLARTSADVVVVHRRDAFRASHVLAQRVLAHPKISVKWNTEVVKFVGGRGKGGESSLQAVEVKTRGEEKSSLIEVAAAFIAIGHNPNTALFRDQLQMEQGYIATHGGTTTTSVKGVFAAGDVADRMYRQAVTSAGTGAMAALDAERWLSEQGLGI